MTDEIINVKPMMIRELFNLLLEAEKELGCRVNVDIKNEDGILKAMIGTLGTKPIIGYGFMISELALMNANNLDALFKNRFKKAIAEMKSTIEKGSK